MRKFAQLLFGLGLLIFSNSLMGQVSLESAPVGTSGDGALIVYGSNTIGNNRIPYDRISGSPFWKNEYILASVIDNSNQIMGKAPIKINLYSNEVYFLNDKGEERVITSGKVRKVIFYKKDNEKEILAVFENNLPVIVENNPNAETPSFVQVMNNGDMQLLKHIKMTLGTADSLFGTMKRYYFSAQTMYYINNKYGQSNRLRKLNKDNLIATINADARAEAWLNQNPLNLKKEEDVVRFLDYLNSRKKG
ncbi:MAG: hypothetical protein ACKVOW_20205 [Chitinophagaceae bacterium]